MVYGSSLFENTRMLTEEEREQQFREACIWEEVTLACGGREEEVRQFLCSDEAKAMMECGYITEANSVVVLSKLDDLSRRTKLAAFEFHKNKNSGYWKKYSKIKALERELEDKMMASAPMAEKQAKKAQKEYIKLVPNAFRRRVTVAPLKEKK